MSDKEDDYTMAVSDDLRKMAKMPKQKPGQSKQDYATPRAFIDAVEARWGKLDIDLAATAQNTRCAKFISPEENSLEVYWPKLLSKGPGLVSEGNHWLNPPYGNIGPWAEKCANFGHYQRASGEDIRLFFLVPASIGSEWFARWVFDRCTILALRPRLSFDGKKPYPKDCILCVYGERSDFRLWKWNSGERP